VFLLLISFVAVPWMLVPKPLILKKRHEAAERMVSPTAAAVAVLLQQPNPPLMTDGVALSSWASMAACTCAPVWHSPCCSGRLHTCAVHTSEQTALPAHTP
jgi:hypothetical protein